MKQTDSEAMDRKIVEYLAMARAIAGPKDQLGIGNGRLAKVKALVE